jgi:hypothetical protein
MSGGFDEGSNKGEAEAWLAAGSDLQGLEAI